MVVEKEMAKGEEIRQRFGKLSDKELEVIVGNHISNPITRVYARTCKGGTLNLYCIRRRTYTIGGCVLGDDTLIFNQNYVPTSDEYRTAKELLSKRGE